MTAPTTTPPASRPPTTPGHQPSEPPWAPAQVRAAIAHWTHVYTNPPWSWWDVDGGRYDHHLALADGSEELLTDCWDEHGGEVFLGAAWSDGVGGWDTELDGSEAACVFGPAADLPVDTGEFAELPGPGEWSQW